MPKRNTRTSRSNAIDNDALIRHHLEEAVTHLGMVKQLTKDQGSHMEAALTKVGTFLKGLYIRHGGDPRA